jgi:hypothetical protein
MNQKNFFGADRTDVYWAEVMKWALQMAVADVGD